MPSTSSEFAPAYPHDSIEKIFDDVYLVHGSIHMGPCMRMNRNMLIIVNNQELTLINPIRLNDAALNELDTLGQVTSIIRLGDFHGLDDEFYLNRYQCDFWAQEGQATYKNPTPNKVISTSCKPPIKNASFFIFESAKYPEAALLLNEQKLLITTDSIQFYDGWQYFSSLTKFAFKLIGFKQGVNIGPPWLKRVTPKNGSLKNDFEKLMELGFNHLIAAHGNILTNNTKEKIRAEIDRVFK